MFLMFALRRRDVLPTGDLAVRAAMKKAYNLAGTAHAGRDGKDRGRLAAVLLGGVLVSVAQPGQSGGDVKRVRAT